MQKVFTFLFILTFISINSQTQITNINSKNGDQSSSPEGFFEFNNRIFYSAKTENLGRELWVSDINEKKTTLLKDINIGSGDGIFYFEPTILNGYLYFFASDGDSSGELWKTDGTENGTSKVTDFLNEESVKITVVNNSLFFVSNKTLWKSDGTPNGTIKVKENLPLLNSITFQTELNNIFVFTLNIENSSKSQVWKSDGTTEGTEPISLVSDGIGIGGTTDFSHYIKYNNELYFIVRNSALFGFNSGGIMKTDGTEIGTVPVKGVHPANTNLISFGDVIEVNNKLYFSFLEKDRNRLFIWESDGTEANTKKIYDFDAGSNFFTPSTFMESEGNLYFFSGNDSGGTSLLEYKTDTEVIEDKLAVQGNVNGPSFFVEEYHVAHFYKISNTRFFTSYTTNFTLSGGNVLDLTNFTFNEYSELGVIGSFFLEIFDEKMIFQKSNLEIGSEVWLHDFNSNITGLFENINTSSYGIQDNFNLIQINDKLVFHANDVDYGIELWRYNPENNNLGLLKDINSTGSSIANYLNEDYLNTFIVHDNQLIFSANDGNNGYEIWQSDGTANETKLLKDLNDDPRSSLPNHFFNFNNNVYFVGYPDKDIPNSFLIKKDGENFINEVDFGMNEVQTNLANEIEQIVPSGNTIFFKFKTGKIALLKTDGSQAGTSKLKEFWQIGNLVDVDGVLFFAAESSDHQNEIELYKSDGTAEGTVLVKNIGASFSSSPSNLTALNGTLYFTAHSDNNGRELWKSDGTEQGTVMIKDIAPANSSAFLNQYFKDKNSLVALNNEIYFSANDGVNGFELWKTDGNTEGTVMVKDINNGEKSSNPKEFTLIDNTLYFQAQDASHGAELWKSDGTEEGTKMMSDVLEGPTGSNPIFITSIGNDLYFKAFSKNAARQVFKLENFKTLSSESTIKTNNISIFPNPTNSKLFIKNADNIKTIHIFNINGQLIKKYGKNINELNLNGLNSGVYFLNILINNTLHKQKIIKN